MYVIVPSFDRLVLTTMCRSRLKQLENVYFSQSITYKFPSSQSTDIGSGAKFKVVETGNFNFNRSRFDIGLFKLTDELVSQTKSIVKLTVFYL